MSTALPTKESSIHIGQASFPKPFYQGLEFNAPAHGSWNIVHIGMLLPQARQIYVCAANCMRGVVLTAAEMHASDRFSFVLLEEADLTMGSLETATIEGVSACIDQLKEKPPVVLLFTVCIHHLLGCDLDYVYRTLEQRYPDIYFCRCYMDPLLQKSHPTPDQKLRMAMYDSIQPRELRPGTISLIGSEFVLPDSCDIYRIFTLISGDSSCFTLKELPACHTYEEYLSMGESSLFLANSPGARMALERLAKRCGRPCLYLPMSFSYAEIASEWEQLFTALTDPDTCERQKDGLQTAIESEIAECDLALKKLKDLTRDTEIRIDYTFHPRPLGLARLLLEHGFHVTVLYMDVISGEEEADFYFLQEQYPSLTLVSTVQTEARTRERNCPDVLAVGQKAAWFSGTKHFVNAAGGGGLFGFDGIKRTARLMEEAYLAEKDTERLIIRKGWGCESCV